MGVWGKIKGWLNIGGVKVKVEDVEPSIFVGNNTMTGKAVLTAKDAKEVLSIKCKVVHERTEKVDGEEETETTILGQEDFLEGFQMAAGETKEIPFSVEYHLEEKMKHMGGVAGAVGKLGSFAMGKKDAYSLIVECDVKGTVLDPSDQVDLKVKKKEVQEEPAEE